MNIVKLSSKRVFRISPSGRNKKKHPWDRIPRGRFHTTILGGFFEAAQKVEFTNIVKLSSKRVFWLSPSGRNEKTPLGSKSTTSVSYHYFGWAFPSSAKSRIDEHRQIEFKTRFSTFPIGAKRKNTVEIEFHEVGFISPFWVGFSKQPKKPKSRISSNWVQNAFFDFPHRGETKKHPWDRNPRRRFHTTIFGGLFQAAQKVELTNIVKLSSKRVFRLSPSGRNEKTPFGSNSMRSVSYHHLGWVFPSSARSRIHEYRQIEFKTRFSTFPIGAKRKNTLGIEIHDVGFIPLFFVGFSKQRKKSNWRRSSNWVQNAFFDFPHRGETKKHSWDRIPRGRFHTTILGGFFEPAQKAEFTNIVKLSSKRVFRLSPSGRNEKTPLGSNSTRSVSYHHFGWVFPSSAKSRNHEYRQIEFKTRFSTFPIGAKRKNTLGIEIHDVGFIPLFLVGFSKQRKKSNWRTSSNWVQNAFFDFPHRGKTKKHPWDRIPRGRFHITIWGGFFQAAQEAEFTNIVKLSSKRVFRLSPSKRNEKTPLGSKSTTSVSYHYFWWAFPSSAKSRIDEHRQIEFKTRFSTFPIGAKRKNTVGIEFHVVGFIPPFWVGFSKQRKKPNSRISSNWVQNAFFDFPHRGETKKHPWDRNPRRRFHTTILGGLFQAAQKVELTNIVKLSSKRVFRLSPSGRNEKTPLGSNSTRSVSYHHFGWVLSRTRKKPKSRISSNWVQNAFFDFPHRGETKKHPWDRNPRRRFHTTIFGGLFQAAQKVELTNIVKLSSKRVFRLSPSGRNEKTPLGSNSTTSVSYHYFGWAFPSSAKSRIDEHCQIEFKTRFLIFPIGEKRTLGIKIHEVGFIPPFWVGFSKLRKKSNWRRSSNWVQNAFFDFPHRGETKKHTCDWNPRGRCNTTILGGHFQAAQKAELTNIVKLSSKRVFWFSPSGRNEPLGSKSTRSVSYHHFGWAFPSCAKSRIDEDRQIEFKTRFSTFPNGAKRKNTLGIEIHDVGFIPPFWVGFSKQREKPNWRISSNWVQNEFFDIPYRGETKRHPSDRNPRGRFHTTIVGGLFQAAQKVELTNIVKLSSKRVFPLSPSGRNEKTPLGSKSTTSVSYHHFGWAFPSSAKSRIDEYRQIEFKTSFSTFPIGEKRKDTLRIEIHEVGFVPPLWVGFSKQRKKSNWRISSNWVQNAFFVFPHRGETKKHNWDRNPRGRFHTTILGGFFQAAQKAKFTNIVKLSSKRVFRLSPSGRNEKTPLGSKSTRSVSYHYFGWAFPSSAKSRIYEYRQIEFKTRFSNFPIGAKQKKTPLGSNSTRSVSYHHFGWVFRSSAKSRIYEYRQIEFKTRFLTFPIGAKRKNTLGIEIHDVGFIPLFWVGFSKQRKKSNWRTSSNWVQNAFFDFPHRGETKKHRWDRIPRGRFHITILGGFFQAAQKAEITNIVKLSSKRVFRLSPSGRNEKTPLGSKSTTSVSYHYFWWAFPSSAKSRIDEHRQIEFKTRFSTFPIGAKRKNTLGIEFHEVGFISPFGVGFSKQRKKPNSRISSNWVQNAFFDFPHRGETKKHPWDRNPRRRFHTTIFCGLFQAAQKVELTNIVKLSSKRVFRLSPSGRNEKTQLGSNSTWSVSYHHFGWVFRTSAKSRIHEYRQIEFKTRFSTFPIGAKRKNTVGIEFHEVGFISPFWVGFSKQRKKPKSRISSNWVQNAFFYFPHRGETKKHPWDRNPRRRFHTTIFGGLFQAAQKVELTNIVKLSSKCVFRLSPSGQNEKTPLGSNSTRSVSYHHLGWVFPSSARSRIHEYRQIEFKTRVSTFPIEAKRKNTLGIEIHDVGFIPLFLVGFSKQRKKSNWRTSSNWVQNAVFDFPHRGETKKHSWDRIPRGRFHTTILGGFFQAA